MVKGKKRIKNKKLFFGCTALMIFNGLLSVGTAYIIMALVDCATSGDLNELWKYAVFAAVYIVIMFIFVKIGTYFENTFLTKEITALHNDTMKRVIGIGFSQYEKHGTGYYLGLFMNDIPLTKESYYNAWLQCVYQISLFVFGLVAMFLINWIVALIAIVISIVPILFSAVYGRKLDGMQKQYLKSFNNYSSSVKSVLSGFGLIKAFHIEDHINTTVADINTKKENTRKKFLIRQGLANGYASTLGTAVMIIVFCVGAYLTIKGSMQIGALMAVVQLMNYILSPISGITESTNSIKSCKSIFDKIDAVDKGNEEKTDVQPFPDDYTIKIENLSYSYEDKQALDGINLTIEAGKKYVIIGENGSGKSTLLNVLGRVNTAYEGNVYFGETEQKDISVDAYYKNLVLLQQDVLILNDTIRNNILLYQNDDSYNDSYEKIVEEVDLSNLAARENSQVEDESELSGGEKQRIAAARALLRKPKILLLDESFSALDPEAKQTLEGLLLNCAETVVAISHDRSEENLSKYDEIIYLSAGKIVAKGSYEQITSYISL